MKSLRGWWAHFSSITLASGRPVVQKLPDAGIIQNVQNRVRFDSIAIAIRGGPGFVVIIF